MNVNFHPATSIFFIFCLWTLIVVSIFFLLNGLKIYKNLKYYEILFNNYKKQLLYNFVPAMVNCTQANKIITSLLNVKAASKMDLTKAIALNLLNNFGFIQKLKLGIFLSKKFLK